MGDENLNNSEDTSVLFVSGQRKKQAEEEAKRKAEQEKAEKEAREAEIRRQEEEVASRIDKAEKLKKNLEIAEQESNKDKRKKALMPVVIGAGAAVVILLVALLWPRHKQVYMDTAEFNSEYAVTTAGYNLKIKYPDTVFQEVIENASEDVLNIEFVPVKKMNISMNTLMANTGYDKNTRRLAWNEINDKLISVSKSYLQGVEIIEEDISDPLSLNSSRYGYTCTYNLDNQTGAYSGWCIEDSNGNVFIEAVDCRAGKKDLESARRLRDQFRDANRKDADGKDTALKIPGSYEPEDTTKTELFKTSSGNLYIPLPEKFFAEVENYTNEQGTWQKWVDENGAIILAGVFNYCTREEFSQISTDQLPDIYTQFEGVTDEYIEGKVDYSDRVKLQTNAPYLTKLDTKVRYNIKINGREYNENDFSTLVANEENVYYLLMYTFTPSERDAIYYQIINDCYENITVEK